MKKILFLILTLTPSIIYGFSGTQQTFKDENAIKREFKNIYLNAQSKQVTIFKSTPNLNDLQDGQIVILSSFTKGFAWRDGDTINMINSSGTMSQINYVTQTSATYISNGVTHITAGTNVTISPAGGTGDVTVNALSGGFVSQIIAGTNVTISPAGGTGAVTINTVDSFFQYDSNGDLQPLVTATADFFYEYDGNGDIQPKL